MFSQQVVKFIITFAVILFVNSERFKSIIAFKVKLSQDEPGILSIYNNYRELTHDRSYFYLKFAGLLRDSDLKGYLKSDSDDPPTFTFNGEEWIRKCINLKWYTPAIDRTSLHVYDDPKEMDLASGPQVNQQMCGQLLEYMIHMMNKHYKHVTDSTELSIFQMLQSFGAPNSGLNQARNMFPGDYRRCMTAQLNVIRDGLSEMIGEHEAKKFFDLHKDETHKHRLSLFEKFNNFIRVKFGLFVVKKDQNPLVWTQRNHLWLKNTRYCMAGLRWSTWPNSSFHKRNMVLRIGVCLPDSCDSKSLKLYHDKIKQLIEVQVTKRFKGYYIDSLYCLPDENSELRNVMNFTSTRLFIYFNIVWISLIFIATSIKYLVLSSSSTKESVNQFIESSFWIYLKCWCFTDNFDDFWMKNRDINKEKQTVKKGADNGNRIYLKPIEGLKVLSSICVVMVHTIVLTSSSADNASVVDYLTSSSIISTFGILSESSVDVFFVITGLITTMILIRKPERILMKLSFWIQFFIYRYIRIVPMYLLIHWALKSYSRFIGSGPFWDYATSYTSLGKVCENDSLWSVVFPSANFKSPTEQCNAVGWYLANDIQFSLITPIFIILFIKRPLVGHLTVLATSFLVMANHVQYYLDRQEPRAGLEFSALTITHVLNEPSKGYTYPQYRCIPYLVGLSAGHLLYMYEIGSIAAKWPRMFVSGCKLISGIVFSSLCFAPYLTLLLPLHDEPLIKLIGSIVAGTLHAVTSIAAAAFILLLCTGHFRFIGKLLGKSYLQPIANCSLCTVLVHTPLLFYHINSVYSLPELSVYYILSSAMIWIVESLIISVLVHILYELPMRKFLIKMIIRNLAPNNKI